jgi:hypothetical protein
MLLASWWRPALHAHLFCALAVTVSFSSASFAQSASANATRRSLIEEATRARDAGNHARAIELAQRAAQIRMSVSLRMFIAAEQATVGQFTQALDNAETCTREVRVEAGVTERDTVAARCSDILHSVQRRVGRVVVQVPGGAGRGVQVRVAGEPMAEALWGVPYVVNPGTVVVEATSSDGASFRREVRVAEAETQNVEVSLQGGSPNAVTATSTATSSNASASSSASQGEMRSPVGSLVVIAVGGAALIASGVLWFLRAQAFQGCDWTGTVGQCDTPDEAARAQSDGRTFNVAAQATLYGGAAVLVGGVLWFVLGRHREPAEVSSRRTSWWVAPHAGGAAFGIEARF